MFLYMMAFKAIGCDKVTDTYKPKESGKSWHSLPDFKTGQMCKEKAIFVELH